MQSKAALTTECDPPYQQSLPLYFDPKEIIVDNFAGGGGASLGILQALNGKKIDIAINHDQEAIELHEKNHPETKHYCESVHDIDPVDVCAGRPVGLVWLSPDCKHHSKARGGKPVNKNIRGLAWVTLKWAGTVNPRIIILENVEEFQDWGPLVAKKRYGQYIPYSHQELRACKKRKGKTFRTFIKSLRAKGYAVEWQEERASSHGAATIRKRFILVARNDNQPIVWPAASHGNDNNQEPLKAIANEIDWSIPCPSIFDRKKPLAENTLKRIAKGMQKFIFDDPDPFIVPTGESLQAGHINKICQTGGGHNTGHSLREPTKTICTKNEHILVTAQLSRQPGNSLETATNVPVGTIPGGGEGKAALVHAFLAQHNTGVIGRSANQPLSTITTAGTQQQIVTATLVNMKGAAEGVGCRDVREPCPTICAGGNHVAEVRAFLTIYYSGGGVAQSANDPAHTITSKPRLGLVLVRGSLYQITDICMRMLSPRELYSAQGFPRNYIIEMILSNGRKLSKQAQVRMCGNSVPPPLARAVVRVNMPEYKYYDDWKMAA